MPKTTATNVQVTTRTERLTDSRPHEWTVTIEINAGHGRPVTIEIGRILQHWSGHPDNSISTVGHEARFIHGSAAYEVDPADHGAATVEGLGIATEGEAVTALVREFMFTAARDRFHEFGPSN